MNLAQVLSFLNEDKSEVIGIAKWPESLESSELAFA